MEFGLYSLSDLVPNPRDPRPVTAAGRIAETIAAAEHAEQAGLDVFGVGEHHRLDFAVSSPAIVLAAIAARTERIRLTSAVTVLSAADPVRVFEDFATVDLISDGRAEIMAGRGVFLDPFPLFGFDIDDYDALFAEKFELLRRLGREERVTWQGRFRPALGQSEIAPRPIQPEMPVWIAVGGTPQSAVRAGLLGAPMAFASLGGPIANIGPVADLYRRGLQQGGHPVGTGRLALTSHMHVGATSQTARDDFYPHYAKYWASASPRGRNLPMMQRDQFEAAAGPNTALLVGSVTEVVDKILAMHEVAPFDRLIAQIDIGGLPMAEVRAVIDRFAGQVVPLVRSALGPVSIGLAA